MSVHTEFDQGSLIWVKGELEQTLARAADALARYASAPADASDTALLKHAQTHLHQAAGALQMVSLDGLARFVEEVEQVVAAVAREEVPPAALTQAKAATAEAGRYLEDLVADVPNQPMALLPRFVELAALRRASQSGAELFFPQLTELELPKSLPARALGPGEWANWLREQRRRFEAALLRWIRDHDPAAAAVLGRALAEIATVQPQGLAKAFWWTASAVAETLPTRAPLDLDLKQLLLRLNMQLRRLSDGSTKVAERLFRDLLYALASDHSGSALAGQLSTAFDLSDLLFDVSANEAVAENESNRQHARALREELSAAKEVWTRVATGQRERLPTLQAEVTKLADRTAALQIEGLAPLWQAMSAACLRYADAGVSEGDALEMATALLLADNALANYPTRSPDFAAQAEVMAHRLADPSAATMDAPQLDEVSREAQEKLLQAQLAQEMRTNLQQVEETLDAYFRDPGTQAALKQLDPGLRQIQGALMMLEKHDAVALLQASQQRIQRYAAQETPPPPAELEELAEALSSLGFYIDAMAQGRDEGSDMLAPSLARLLGGDVEEVAVPELAELEQEPELAPPPAVAAPVETEPVEAPRALPSSDEAVDAELLEVYLEEAVEVLATIDDNLAVLRANPHDREALTVLRRSFHTLKGSGRMVGLNLLGEVAWGIEQTLNKWLQAEQPAADALLALVGDVHVAFAGWVEELAQSGSAQVDEAPWAARAEALRHQFDNAPAEPLQELEVDTASSSSESAEPVSDEVQIGDVTVSSTLFAIFRDEATRHVATLKKGADVLEAGDVPPGNFELAAHTLGGIASTAGFRPLGELAYALEHSVQQLGKTPGSVISHARELTSAVAKLDRMLGTVFALQPPESPEPNLSELVSLANEPLVLALDETNIDVGEALVELVVDHPELEEVVTPAELPHVEPLEEIDFSLDLGSLEAPVAAPHAEPLHEQIVDAPEAHAATDATLAEVDELAMLDGVAAAPVAEPVAGHDAVHDEDLAALADLIELDLDEAPAPHPVEVAAEPDEINLILSDELLDAEPAEVPAAPVADFVIPTAPTEAAGDALDEGFDLTLDEAPAEPAVASTLTEEATAAEPAFDLDLTELDVLVDEPVAEAPVQPESHAEPVVEAPLLEQSEQSEEEDVPELHELVDLPPAESDLAAELLVEPAIEPTAVAEPEPEVETLLMSDEAVELLLTEEEPQAKGDSLAAQAAEPPAAFAAPEAASPLAALLATIPLSLNDRKTELEAAVVDEIDDQLLPVFIEEADELMPQIGDALRSLREHGVPAAVNTLKRTLHTLKGSARMSGAMRIGEATHEMESRLLASAAEVPGPALLDELEADYDLILAIYDELTGRKKPAKPAAGAEQVAATATAAQPLLAAPDAEGKTTIRVRSELVDELVNQAGEVAIARSRIEAEMLAVKGSLLDLTDNVTRLRGQLRELEIQAESQMQARVKEFEVQHQDFDPLEFDRFTRLQEITRFIAESVNDVATIQHNLLKNLDDSSAALTAQNRMTKELQQSLMRVRMVPFSSVSDRLYRLTRQTGKEVGKKVNLEIRGGRVEIDRGVLEKMISPFEHMLRNAIDHGLETVEERATAGKTEFGEVVVEVRQEGNELVVILKDDGRGMNLERIRAKGESLGLIAPGSEPTDRDLMHLIFEPGFSTASNVTQISGRGIGMDVVKNEIGNLGGRVDVTSAVGSGTTFTIHLPLTLAVTQVLLVKAGERLLAIPSVMVEQVQELKQEALARLYSAREQEWLGGKYPFAYFPRLVGDGQSVPEQKRFSTVLLLRSGVDRMALHIDHLVKNQEVVVKQIGTQLARVPGVAGATVLGNGDIVLIVNPLALFARGEIAPTQKKAAAAPDQLHTAPLVMVVDDSLTVRKITTRLLAREGFQVVTAKDGVDALQQLQDVTPAVMLVDIEMPRMDGFELTRNVRADDGTKHIPIIMITSRTADKHKNVAFDMGVNVFMGKPFQEEELLGHIREFTGA
ncbi:Hpt domain-containing protein [Andreprevotia chitinilytica]|uniref:Hpt domain-containing protein n=1 Tax=Andreprevotia chitinilytica TaxID=396808 RepID=UPI000558994D|nr:Hpt domain-containing protein [Andreprevotia chitinilytica]